MFVFIHINLIPTNLIAILVYSWEPKVNNFPNVVLGFPKSGIFSETNSLMVRIMGGLDATWVSHITTLCFLVYGSSMVFQTVKWG